ncbi:MAG: (deoxy)nucleoside triphosphate pyrophosphohydrolase [Candidatus Omnitrophota bacterium]|nr:(deoxy)nucleoside triphosphate pyrophosphohydrolase [Candidatus Omnitrophota bacterium]
MDKIMKDVAGALIEENGKFLVARRKLNDSFGGFWEFPGGSVEEGETREEALKREIKEELGLDIKVGKKVFEFSGETAHMKINIHLFESKIEAGLPRAIDCDDVRWAGIDELKKLKFIPADKKALEWLEGSIGKRGMANG